MEPGFNMLHGYHSPREAPGLPGYPQGWEPIPDMPAPPGYEWGTFEAGYEMGDGFGNGYGGGFGATFGPGGPWSGGYGGFGGYDDPYGGYRGYGGGYGGGFGGGYGVGFGGGYGGGFGGPWVGPHGRTFREPEYARRQQWGPGIYADGTMNYTAAAPPQDDGMPGVNLRNTLGGIGAEPGYNYLYPSEHTKIHVMYSEHPPWHNDGNYYMNCFHVPSNITTKELMQQFGCKNDDKEKNCLVELAQANDGRFYKGLAIQGDNKDLMKKSISEVGWNKDRDGIKESVVYLWFTSDYKPNE